MHRLTRWLTVFSVFSTGCTTKEIHNHYYLSGDTGSSTGSGAPLDDSDTGVTDDVSTGVSADMGGADSGTVDAGTDPADLPAYCDGADPLLVDCDPDVNYDPWIVNGGERPYWIRDGKTLSFPFTVESSSEVDYGYFQITSGERQRNTATEDIFHVWISETPNGPVLSDGDEECERWAARAQLGYLQKFTGTRTPATRHGTTAPASSGARCASSTQTLRRAATSPCTTASVMTRTCRSRSSRTSLMCPGASRSWIEIRSLRTPR